MKRTPLLTTLIASLFTVATASVAFADDAAVKDQIDQLQKQIDALKAQVAQQQVQASKAKPPEAEKKKEEKPSFLQLKPGDAVTFATIKGGEVTVYGNLDVSFDYTTKGLKSDYGDSGGMPVGNMGWQPAIASNLSYLGLRGKQPLLKDFNFVWQLEGGVDISATPGTKNTTSNNSDAVNGALFSRDSFLGFSGQSWGSLAAGKRETTYKKSTDRLNPFSAMIGDYRVIMGNTGGDNRVEFGYRAPHAIWYETPNWSGVSLEAMYAPGQNRDDTSSIVPSAEPDCAGGNIPGSGALPPTCNDGSFGDLYSARIAYANGPLYVVTAWELHKNVNRTSDLPAYDPNDIANEQAFKIGAQYTFPTKTTVSALWERTWRSLPGYLRYQDERSRPNATWLAITQVLSAHDSVSVGWAHAGSTPGDPGQHNTPGGANPDNQANMFTAALRHSLGKSVTIYLDWALTDNHTAAHYDLGAGGHGVTTDCHDSTPEAAFDPTTGGVSNTGPHCYAGGQLQGVSLGVNYKF
jgi:predicted porin